MFLTCLYDVTCNVNYIEPYCTMYCIQSHGGAHFQVIEAKRFLIENFKSRDSVFQET